MISLYHSLGFHTLHRLGQRRFLILLVLIGLIPLFWPALPPLTDLPGHMGRWHIAMTIGRSPTLAKYYALDWAPVGNLGMDIIVPVIATVMPFELAAKVGVLLIPAITMAGLLWTAKEVHGSVPPTAIFALPFVYSWPFQYGFVNFCLAQGLAFCAFALWIRLGRNHSLLLRALLFLPITCALWLTHSFGWALFLILVVGAELAIFRSLGRSWSASFFTTSLQAITLILPLAFMMSQPRRHGALADDWFNWSAKLVWMISILRDRWLVIDILSLAPVALILYVAVRNTKVKYSATLGWPALLCTAAFILLPRLALGGAYVDMRMAPIVAMISLLAIAPPVNSIRLSQALAVSALAFFLFRTAVTTTSYLFRSYEQQSELLAVMKIPIGASVLSLVARPCSGVWSDLRRDHLPSMAIVRRNAFTNDQWSLEGQQLLRIKYRAASPYISDPSQLVYPRECTDIGSNFAEAITHFPRHAFTYVWTIGFPPYDAKEPYLNLAWTNGRSSLYKVRQQ